MEMHVLAIEYYQTIGLSKRELEIIFLKATLRTHLNKVYTKVSEAGD
jgi:hypothetical protein